MTILMSNYILTDKEAELLKLIANTGVYVNNFNKKLDIGKKIIDKCVKKGWIEKDSNKLIYGSLFSTYYLSKLGKEIVKGKFLISPYRSKPNQVEHDYILGRIYLNLTSEEKDTWINETELMLRYPRKNVTDGLYVNSIGEKVGVEVITDSYTTNIIKEKEAFIKEKCNRGLVVNTKEFY